MGESLTIGISAFFQHSFFSNGVASCMLSLADALAALGHTPVLINLNQDKGWWDDVEGLQNRYKKRFIGELTEAIHKGEKKLDLFVDIDGFIVPKSRSEIANRVVVFIRKPTFLHEMEHTVYPISGPVRNLTECDAVWTWSIFSSQDIAMLELLSKKPVFSIPQTWSAAATEEHGKELPLWSDMSSQSKNWFCHIMENNQTSASSCTIPLVVAAQAKTHTKVPLEEVAIHNSQTVAEHKFFQENVLAHCRREGLQFHFQGRQRIADWRTHPRSFILSHIRFLTIKPALLDAIQNGIPVIHNSPYLRDIGLGLERFYQDDNSVKGATKAMETMIADQENSAHFFEPGRVTQIREEFQKRFDPKIHSDLWSAALQCKPLSLSPKQTRTEIVVGFSDFWDDFRADQNFWTLLITEACRKMNLSLSVRGIPVRTGSETMDLLFFGPFGSTWKNVSDKIPKIHHTGENTPPVPEATLNLCFDATDLSRKIYRFPLWIQQIDWFGANQTRLHNPRSMPIDMATGVQDSLLDAKSKFCAFVVSNPTNEVRNRAFQVLSSQKKVDSAGRFLNNIGGDIFTEIAGGGSGELKKLEFLKSQKFCIAQENSKRDGQSTEKFLAAKAAGCVPIQWGSDTITQDFPEGSFIDANRLTESELVEAVTKMDADDAAWRSAAAKPAISVAAEQKRLAEVARLILEPILGSQVAYPESLGAATTQEAAALREAREGSSIKAPLFSTDIAEKLTGPLTHSAWNQKTLLVTQATHRQLDCVAHWIPSAELHASLLKDVSIRVQLGDDIGDETMNVMRSEHPNVEFKRIPSASLTIPGFPDFWDAQNFGWKLWLYQDLVQEKALENTLIWYMDSGSILVRWPTEWFEKVTQSTICFLEDSEQFNNQWCQKSFCEALRVTNSELAQKQIVGGILAFLGGAEQPWKIFTEAFSAAQNPLVLKGPKWAGVRADGKAQGHRHDQSILSILRLRHGAATYPLERVQNHESLRRTFKTGCSLQVHRGRLIENNNFAKRIGEVHLINLPRRKDRIQRFKENHESWTKQVCLRPAIDGRQLKLTPSLIGLFGPNDFFWKKSVMGCALSHLSLWLELAAEQPSCENYLILEDDVKFQKNWLDIWNIAAENIPADQDVLYLGGVLPPNREVFSQLLEPVNESWSRVQKNQLFGQKEPTRQFHFCNQAQILSRNGARKILELIQQHNGYQTSADHMICNQVDTLNHQVLNPVVAGCQQDEDPKYATSQFNNFSRVDNFDSDLWNNDERFSMEDIQAVIGDSPPQSIHLGQAVQDAQIQMNTVVAKPAEKSKFYTVGSHKISKEDLMEYKWLRELFGAAFETIVNVAQDHEPLDGTPIFIFMKGHEQDYLPIFDRQESLQKKFCVLHLSDEFCDDRRHFQKQNSCETVIRTQPIPGEEANPKIITIPLGYHRTAPSDAIQQDHKPLMWSFSGTAWQNRKEKLESWIYLQPYSCHFFDTWADSQQLTAEQYTEETLKSVFIPCPRGQNVETFRFWEALEHGAIPIQCREPGDDVQWNFLTKHLPLVSFQSFSHALPILQSMIQNPPTLMHYRTTILNKQLEWKKQLKEQLHALLN